MTEGEFADTVYEMRSWQRKYFRTRSRESRRLEKTVDDMIAERERRLAKERLPELFGNG